MGAACQSKDHTEGGVEVEPVSVSHGVSPSLEKEGDRDALSTASTQSGSSSLQMLSPDGSTVSKRAAVVYPAPAAMATRQSVNNGEITLHWDDGASYTGSTAKSSQTSRGVMHGNGTWTSGDGGTSYTGEWLEDRYHGKGKLVSEVGTYDGEFRKGAFDGQGVMQWLDLRYYEGEWKQGKRHGYGVNCSRVAQHGYDMGHQRVGYWEQNRFVGFAS